MVSHYAKMEVPPTKSLSIYENVQDEIEDSCICQPPPLFQMPSYSYFQATIVFNDSINLNRFTYVLIFIAYCDL